MAMKDPIDHFLHTLSYSRDADISQVDRTGRLNSASGIVLFDHVTLSIHEDKHEGQSAIGILSIEVEKTYRSAGLGKKAMQLIIETCLKNKITCTLYARSYDQSALSNAELAAWYERFGFVRTPRGHYLTPKINFTIEADDLLFPNGTPVHKAKKEAKKLKKLHGFSQSEALNLAARGNGVDLPWPQVVEHLRTLDINQATPGDAGEGEPV